MDRSERIGRWVSGIGHVGILGWAAIGGALFGPQPSPPIQMTQVATMTEAEFQDFAAASRGAGPVQGQQQEVATLPQPAADDVQSGALEAAQSPEPEAEAQPLPEPETEDAPDLTDLAEAQPPVEVATALPQQELPSRSEEPAESAPQPVTPPAAETATPQPEAPETPALPDAAVTPPSVPELPAPPRSELALDNSPRPRGRPDGLVENRNRRLAEEARQAQEAARRQAEAEEAAREEAAEAERQAAEAEAEARARAEADQARAREEAAAREAEEARRAEAERQAAAEAEAERLEQERLEQERAEADRLAAEEAERQRQEDERLAAEREQQEREAAEAAEAERDRIAAEEAERARQEAAEAEQAARDAEAAAEEARQRAEEASPDQDALTAALSEALGDPAADSDSSGGATDGAPLSLSEREGFRLAINECWRVGSLSREAQATSVTVAFSMSQNGMPEPGTMRLMGHSGGSPAAAQQAYEAAQRAVLNCAGTGYGLPVEKYNRWKDVIIDFSPNGVGVK